MMFKTILTAAVVKSAPVATTVFSRAVAPASRSGGLVAKVVETANDRQGSVPMTCGDEVWPFQSASCIAAIMAENGMPTETIRVVRAERSANDLPVATQVNRTHDPVLALVAGKWKSIGTERRIAGKNP